MYVCMYIWLCACHQETITNMDVTELIGARPFAGSKEYAEYIALGWKKTVVLTETTPVEEKDNNGEAIAQFDFG